MPSDPAFQTGAPLQAGIIGAGRMGITHLAILGGHPGVQVSAICDDSTLMTHTLSRYRPEIKIYKDYRKMLESQKLDMVLIATPPDLHGPMIQAAMDCNLSVFVEKPFTLDGEEAKRLAARSRSAAGTHQVGYVNRFNDVFMKVRDLLDKGCLGRLITFRSDMFGRTVIRKESGSGWRGNRKAGGGCLFEFGSHAIDLVVYLLGKPDKVLGSMMTSIYSEKVEDLVRTHFAYESGLVGSLTVNWSDESYRKPTNQIEIMGENGKLVANQHELKIHLKEPRDGFVAGWNTVYITDIFQPVPFYVRGNEFTRQLWHFADRAMDPGPGNQSSFEDGARTQEVIDMVLADAGVEV